MDVIVYIIDKATYKHLSENHVTQNVNFWMSELKYKITSESCFYFKIKQTNFIAGRGRFIKSHIRTKAEALNFYKINCGTPTIINENDATKNLELIKCHEVEDIQWLRKDQFYEISENAFPKNTPVFKSYFSYEQIEAINQDFESALSKSIDDFVEEEEEDLNEEFQEGSIRLSTHIRQERNQKLIRQVKTHRQWNCEICNFNFKSAYGVEYIEAHHKVPLYLSGNTINSENEIALLCANCHKTVHIIMKRDELKVYEEIVTEIIKRKQ